MRDSLDVGSREEGSYSSIREFYHTLVKVNEGYYKVKEDRQDFHLRSGHIARHSRVSGDGDKAYIDNVQLEHLVT